MVPARVESERVVLEGIVSSSSARSCTWNQDGRGDTGDDTEVLKTGNME